jgi:8-oxo-dGTP pyrophosphatase MutT (NUDIX family)
MDFEIDRLRARLKSPLPGDGAHREVMSYIRETAREVRLQRTDYREGAVLMLLYPHRDELHTCLIVRPDYDGVHSGQMAFPGGKREVEDHDLSMTALREAYEEVGIQPESVDLIGCLSEIYIPPSNFLVSPFLGVSAYRPDFLPDQREVAGIVEVPLSLFMDERAIQERAVRIKHDVELVVPAFDVYGNTVWGATAMMLAEFRAVVKSLVT